MPRRALFAGGSGSNFNAPSCCTVPVTTPAAGLAPVTFTSALSKKPDSTISSRSTRISCARAGAADIRTTPNAMTASVQVLNLRGSDSVESSFPAGLVADNGLDTSKLSAPDGAVVSHRRKAIESGATLDPVHIV